MFLKRIDILSETPQVSIFNEGSNKTLFGGFLSLIFLLFFLLIAIAYLVDYILNDKYEVQYSMDQKAPVKKNFDEIYNEPNSNPTMNFTIVLTNDDYELLSDRFVIYDGKNFVPKTTNIYSNISSLFFGVYY